VFLLVQFAGIIQKYLVDVVDTFSADIILAATAYNTKSGVSRIPVIILPDMLKHLVYD
jgi:hypothetical protein